MVAKVLIKEMYRLKQNGDGRKSSFSTPSRSHFIPIIDHALYWKERTGWIPPSVTVKAEY
jgi:hypothetical protein